MLDKLKGKMRLISAEQIGAACRWPKLCNTTRCHLMMVIYQMNIPRTKLGDTNMKMKFCGPIVSRYEKEVK